MQAGTGPKLHRKALIAAALLSAAVAIYAAWPEPLLHGIRIEAESSAEYDRYRDYGGWTTKDCMSTRMTVLRDESDPGLVQIRRRENGSCEVAAGQWRDPYTDAIITTPWALDIDHLVPLKEAHQSGAHTWPKSKRVEYANHLADEWHLLAISAAENRRKGDRDPAQWLPPNGAFVCTYLTNWIRVKRKWDLSMDDAEAAAVSAQWEQRGCEK